MLVSNNSCSPDDTPIDPEPSFPEKPQGLLEEHPRIMLLPDEEALIWQAIQSTPQWRKMHDAIIDA
ncbi:MAG: hypothetical protein ACLFQA_11900, partial [Bacteroidales bacterium]